MGDNEQPGNLILLVGSNPLPNYLAAVHLQPKHVHLIFTDETRDVRDRLSHCLTGCGIGVTEKPEYQLEDAVDAAKIRRVTTHLPKNAGLNYTGGTKTMATHVHAHWLAKLGGKDSFASYLDDRSGQLRFDDGVMPPLQSNWIWQLSASYKASSMKFAERSRGSHRRKRLSH